MNIVIYIVLLLVGAVIGLVLQKPTKHIFKKFIEKAPLIKKYWVFIIPFVILNIIAYWVVAIYFYSDINFNLIGQISGLILAIFAGYIAFSEFGESKYDKLIDAASLATDRLEYNLAKIRYEEACAIKPKDNQLLGNLLEIYLILGEFNKFDEKIDNYMRYSVEPANELTHIYLVSMRWLMQEHMGEARAEIQKAIEYVDTHTDSRKRFYWSNDALERSEAFRQLGTGTQKVIKNYFAYLKQRFNSTQEQQFVSGDYENVI